MNHWWIGLISVVFGVGFVALLEHLIERVIERTVGDRLAHLEDAVRKLREP